MPHQVETRRFGGLRSIGLCALLGVVLTGCAGSSRTGGVADAEINAVFWPPAPNEPRLQFLRSIRVSSDVEEERSAIDRIVFGDAIEAMPVAKPYGVEMWNGRFYVCDITNPSVVIFDLEKRQTRLMMTRGVEQMAQPTDIAIAEDGMKYVVDRRLGRIFVFDADDRHVTTFGDRGLVPTGVAVHGDEIYVPDFETQSVLVLDRFRGTQRRAIGGPGGDRGQFVRPLGVHVDAEGNAYVSDVIRGRVQQFDASGGLIRSIGEIGDAPGSFVRPKHVTVDDDGNLYVVDAAFQNVQMFDDEGELLMFFGGPGEYPGAMSLPAGITVSEDLGSFASLVHPAFEAHRLVIVTNQFGPNKLAVYAMGQLREGYTVADVHPFGVSPYEPPPEAVAPETRPAEPDDDSGAS